MNKSQKSKRPTLKEIVFTGINPPPQIGNIQGRDTFYRPERIVIKKGPNKGTWARIK